MDWRSRSPRLVSLASMIIVLLVAFGLDRLLVFLRQENATTFTLSEVLLWSYVLADLLLAICLLILFWIVTVKGDRSRLVAVIFLAVGLPMVFALLIYFVPPFAALNLTDYLLPDKLLFHSGAFIAAIGLLSLVLPKNKTA